MSIFISIASYQDPLLESTVFSAINNADNPNNLVFGICDQSSNIRDLSAYNAQSEIKEFSDSMKELISDICPHTIKSFEKYNSIKTD